MFEDLTRWQRQGLICLGVLKFFVPPQFNAPIHALKYAVLKYLITCINVLLLLLPEFESLPWVVRRFCKVGVSDLELLITVLGCGGALALSQLPK